MHTKVKSNQKAVITNSDEMSWREKKTKIEINAMSSYINIFTAEIFKK